MHKNRPVGVVVKDTTIGAGGLQLVAGPVKLDTGSPVARHRCEFSSEQRCPGTKPRKCGICVESVTLLAVFFI